MMQGAAVFSATVEHIVNKKCAIYSSQLLLMDESNCFVKLDVLSSNYEK